MQNHRDFQKAVRRFFDEVVYDDAQVSDYPKCLHWWLSFVFRPAKKMVNGQARLSLTKWRKCDTLLPRPELRSMIAS